MAARPLTLHASALSNEEYTLYTTSLIDLAGEDEHARSNAHEDSYYAALQISAREARAWIRGRYTDLPHANVDAVLKLFCPALGVADLLSGGQFFAALRLVTHLRQGQPLDGNLVFVQAHPDDAVTPTQEDRPSTDSYRTSRDLDASSQHATLPPSRSQPSRPPPPPKPPSIASSAGPSTAGSSTNPFINRSKSQPIPPVQNTPPFSQQQQQQSGAVIPPLPPRKSSQPPPHLPPPPPRHSSLSSTGSAPVLPSGQQTPTTPSAFAFWHGHSQPGSTPTNPNVLIQQSLQAGRIAQSLKKAEKKLEKERVLEVLKRSSKTGNANGSGSLRNRSESPSNQASTGIIASKTRSSMSSSTSESASASSDDIVPARPSTRASSATVTSAGRGPALPPRRGVRRSSPPPPSSTGSTRSFEQVAHASIYQPRSATKPRFESPFARDEQPERRSSPPPQHPDLLPPPPPTHPDRKAPEGNDFLEHDQASSPTSRVTRSKSMHYASPPVPPPRRRRPESVQYSGGSPFGGGAAVARTERTPSPTKTDRSSRSLSSVFSSPAALPSRAGPGSGAGVSRHSSLSMHRRRESATKDGLMGKDDSPMSSFKNTLMGLQPRLDAARYKAEAGFSRRGFVPHGQSSVFREEGEERLVASGTSSVSVSDDDGGLGQDMSVLEMDEADESRRPHTGGAAAGQQRWNGKGWEEAGRARSSSANGTGVDVADRRPRKPWEVERDEMKWPTGDGWKPL